MLQTVFKAKSKKKKIPKFVLMKYTWDNGYGPAWTIIKHTQRISVVVVKVINCNLLVKWMHIFLHIQGVPGGMDKTLGECSLG